MEPDPWVSIMGAHLATGLYLRSEKFYHFDCTLKFVDVLLDKWENNKEPLLCFKCLNLITALFKQRDETFLDRWINNGFDRYCIETLCELVPRIVAMSQKHLDITEHIFWSLPDVPDVLTQGGWTRPREEEHAQECGFSSLGPAWVFMWRTSEDPLDCLDVIGHGPTHMSSVCALASVLALQQVTDCLLPLLPGSPSTSEVDPLEVKVVQTIEAHLNKMSHYPKHTGFSCGI